MGVASGVPGAGSCPCPGCGSADGHDRPTFTWWGGLLGPKLLKHAVCRKCGAGFNWETGKSNTGGIILYSVVALGIALVLFALLALLGGK